MWQLLQIAIFITKSVGIVYVIPLSANPEKCYEFGA